MNQASQKKVLVVDGDPDVARQVAAWLKDRDAQVVAAQDGETGFMRFKKESPGAAIIAAHLPKVVGSVLCQRIKKNPATASTLVLLASEKYAGHPELGDRAVQMFGADGFVPKPLDREATLEALKSYLGDAVSQPAASQTPSASRPPPPPPPSPPSPPSAATDAVAKKSIDELPELPSEGDAPLTPPVLQGNLQTMPLPQLLIRLSEVNRTGVLTIERNRIKRQIYFRDGCPVHAASTLRTENPALMLVRDEIVTEEEYSKSLIKMTNKGMSMNEAIVASTTLTYEALYEHVRRYEQEILINSFAWHEGHFEFTPADKLPDYVPSFDFSLLKTIYEGVGRHYPLKLLSGPVHEHKEEYAHRTMIFSQYVNELDLDPAKLKFSLLIDGKTQVRELVTLGRDDLYSSYQLLWTYQLAKMIAFSVEPKEVKSAEFMTKTEGGEAAKEPLPQDLQAAIMREYYRVKSSNYFKTLQVPLTAEKDQVDRAFHEIEEKFHPDNLSKYDLRQTHGKLMEIVEKAKASHRVLSDQRTRREYRHYLEVQDRQRAKDEVVQAEIAFKNGEKALKTGDFDEARDLFETAINLKPDEPDYYAYLGWALFMGARKSPDAAAQVKRAKQELGKAVVMNPDSDKAYLILGRLYAGEGNPAMAMEHFEKALKVNPDCAPAKVAIEIIRKGKLAPAATPDPQAGP